MWQLDDHHGEHVSLSDDCHTAVNTRGGGADHGIVLSCLPMEPNMLYEVKVEEIHPCWSCPLPCGVVRCPDMLSLPASASAGWDSAVVFSNAVYDRGSRLRDLFHTTREGESLVRSTEVYTDHLVLPDTVSHGWDSAVVFRDPFEARDSKTANCTCIKGPRSLGRSLEDLTLGARVGVMVDAARGLHLFVNGRHVTTVSCVPTPCYAFFELLERYVKITTRPLRRIQANS
ncbi:neuralized-like protein 4 [Littorina saxatilis]|uniref:NHR domain-containing protein n=1 Tax=Littorina saxatilis TaxID=31220 RepID=A0AAN9AX51_9CAEN